MTESVTMSVALDDMSLEQLEQLAQGLARQADALKAQRLHVRAKIDARVSEINAQNLALRAGNAPGAVIEAAAR